MKSFWHKGIFFLLLVLFHCKSQSGENMFVIKNAKIWTGNPDQPYAEALWIDGNRIRMAGSLEDFNLPKNIREIDAKGHFIVPGFIDAHLHFVEGGQRLSSVQLRDARTPEEFILRIQDYAGKVAAGTWITGGDWDHENWGGELPDREWIDSVSYDNPIFISRLDGHMALANSKAMELAGIQKDIAEVEGGSMGRDATGRLSGIFRDNAMGLIYPFIPEPSKDQLKQALLAAMDYVASHGVSSVHHVSADLDFLNEMKNEGILKTRIYGAIPLTEWKTLAKRIKDQGRGDEWLRYGALKAFADGSLGSQTAWFKDPYSNNSTEYGLNVMDLQEMFELALAADSANLQLIVHAIGDRANHEVLNLYERVIIQNGPRDRRSRIEHAQHLDAADIPRFGKLGIIASVQPYHLMDDGRWAEKLIGKERTRYTYAFRSLLDTGAKLAGGSDWFVAPPTPLEGIYGAVTRRTLDGLHLEGWIPEEKISLEEALKMYTIDAAYASFEEDIKGSIENGKLADFVILSHDLFSIEPEEIINVEILATFVDGRLQYGKLP
ncbi:MAG: amidohydrolase [Cyclobacteriaceae bacterium]|nr:amidohydrolase [Cyclobacteriaceae bacterium]